ncbi:MAG: metallophosphoesterase family protein [Candidatus Methanofastidiosia archaeon]
MMRIVQISDTHISLHYHFRPEIFKQGMKMAKSLKYDLALHGGDITENGYEEEYRLAKDLITVPKMKYVLGNHDARNVGYELFEKYFGHPQSQHVTDKFACGCFDSTIPDRNEGRIGKTDIKIMKEFLDETSEKFKIVVFHHHLLPVPRSGRERNLLTDAGNVLKIVLDYRADLVLSSHRHSFNTCKIDDTVIVNSATFSSSKTRAGDEHSFNYITAKDGKIEVRRFDIESNNGATETRHASENCFVPVSERKFRIVHISDTHFGEGKEFLSDVYNSAVKKINALSPDLVVHAGDITNDGLPQSYRIADKKLSQVKFPKLIVPGTRDYKHLGEELFGAYFPQGNFVKGDINVIWADSVKFEEEEGLIGRRQLKKILDSIKDNMFNIVVFHHHIIPIPHTKERDVIEDAGNVLKKLCNKVQMILNGSRHISFACNVDGTVIANSNTLSSRRIHGRYGNTFNLIDILKNNAVVISDVGSVSGVRRVLGIYKACAPGKNDAK